MSSSPKEKKSSKKGGKVKAEKKRKDPDAPKKPLSAWLYYTGAKREQVLKENPEIKFGEVTKKISEMWKCVGSGEKKKYEDMAAQDKKRYAKELSDYQQSGGAAVGAKPAKKKKVAQPESDQESDGGSDEE